MAGSGTAVDKWMLVLSGFIGIVIGDQAWLLAMQRIGARRVIVEWRRTAVVAGAGFGLDLIGCRHWQQHGGAGRQ